MHNTSFTSTCFQEFDVWPFVASDKWNTCSSLRITAGTLLNSVLQAYADLESEGLVRARSSVILKVD